MTNLPVEKLISDADSGLRVWKGNRELKLKDVTITQYQNTRDGLETINAEVESLAAQLT